MTEANPEPDEAMAPRRGRLRSTSCRELQLIALRLFTERGFENMTTEQIAAEAGVSERTFFRYFASKASVLWTEFEAEVDTIRAALSPVPDDVPMMDAVRHAVVSVTAGGPSTSPRNGYCKQPAATFSGISTVRDANIHHALASASGRSSPIVPEMTIF